MGPFHCGPRHQHHPGSGSQGIITTVADDGISGYSGDGGMAANAELHSPEDVSVDAFGNLFIANLFNNASAKWEPTG